MLLASLSGLMGKCWEYLNSSAMKSSQPDSELLELMTAIGSQIGQFIERKRTENLLRESESRFRQLADAMPQIVWAARPDGFIDYYNERWYEFTGFSRGDERLNRAGSRFAS